jgi:hypothetical protein
MIWSLNDHFVRPYAIHAIKQAISLTIQVPFDS